MLRVPLLLRSPGVRKAGLFDAPFSHIHLAPTLLEVIGMDAPPEFEGRSYGNEARQAEIGNMLFRSPSAGVQILWTRRKRMHGRVLAVQDRRYKLVLGLRRQFGGVVRSGQRSAGTSCAGR